MLQELWISADIVYVFLWFCLSEDANDCEFIKKKVNNGRRAIILKWLCLRGDLWCRFIVPFCFSALLPHYNFPLDEIENKENVYQGEK